MEKYKFNQNYEQVRHIYKEKQTKGELQNGNTGLVSSILYSKQCKGFGGIYIKEIKGSASYC